MRVKIELEKDETLQDAEEFLEKSLKAKSECDHGERYADAALNEAHDLICSRFEDLLSSINSEIEEVINAAKSASFK